MPDLSAKSRASENEYFLRKEKELTERLKAKAAAEARRKGLAEAIGLENDQILDVLHDMGFDRSTVVILFLFPLLQVAWTDGEVSDEERELILIAAQTHGINEGDAAHEKLVGYLKNRPEPILFERALTVIKDLLNFQTAASKETTSTKLMDACERIAAASGGFLGVGSKISAKERQVLRRVASAIGGKHSAVAAKLETALNS